MFQDRNEGGIGLRTAANLYRLSTEKISNYLCNVAWYLYTALKDHPLVAIRWAPEVKRLLQRGFVYALSDTVRFVYGKSIPIWRPRQEETPTKRYCRHKKQHSFNTLVWNDNFGIITKVDMVLEGRSHEKGLYNETTEAFCQPERFFSNKEKVTSDSGFQGKGSNVNCPFKANQMGGGWRQKCNCDRTIHKQWIKNEGPIGFVKSGFRRFIG